MSLPSSLSTVCEYETLERVWHEYMRHHWLSHNAAGWVTVGMSVCSVTVCTSLTHINSPFVEYYSITVVFWASAPLTVFVDISGVLFYPCILSFFNPSFPPPSSSSPLALLLCSSSLPFLLLLPVAVLRAEELLLVFSFPEPLLDIEPSSSLGNRLRYPWQQREARK